MKVTLEVPDAADFQLVYRMVKQKPFECTWDDEYRFVFLRGCGKALGLAGSLRHTLGAMGMAKAIAKLASPARSFYAVLAGRKGVSYGWGMTGRCKYYKIEKEATVIGPIWSDPSVRGRGVASSALKAAINEYIREGKNTFYIDTSKTNLSAQRVFEKCGFGEPTALYFR